MNLKEEKNYLQRILSILTSVGLAISGWFLTTAYNQLDQLNNRVQTIELKQAETSGNRFTSADWTNAKTIIDADRLALDKRLIVVEENNRQVREMLVEIKQDLKEIKSNTNTNNMSMVE